MQIIRIIHIHIIHISTAELSQTYVLQCRQETQFVTWGNTWS
jgi:hypothetical protein